MTGWLEYFSPAPALSIFSELELELAEESSVTSWMLPQLGACILLLVLKLPGQTLPSSFGLTWAEAGITGQQLLKENLGTDTHFCTD